MSIHIAAGHCEILHMVQVAEFSTNCNGRPQDKPPVFLSLGWTSPSFSVSPPMTNDPLPAHLDGLPQNSVPGNEVLCELLMFSNRKKQINWYTCRSYVHRLWGKKSTQLQLYRGLYWGCKWKGNRDMLDSCLCVLYFPRNIESTNIGFRGGATWIFTFSFFFFSLARDT